MTLLALISERNVSPAKSSVRSVTGFGLLEDAIDPASVEVNEGRLLNPAPLPLAEVLANVDALHARCNGEHYCGLSPRLQKFDLYHDYLIRARAARRKAA